MKDITNFLNESKTDLIKIEQYAKSWTTEWDPQAFFSLVSNILAGLQRGVEENKKYYKDPDSQNFINDSQELLNNFEQELNKYNK